MRRRYQYIAVFVCLCLMVGTAPGLVMCVGCDGEVALRPGLHVHKEHTAPANTPPLAQQPADDHEDGDDHQHCSRCVDVPLSMYAVDQGAPDDGTDLLALIDLGEAHTTGTQADSLALRPIQETRETPYFTSLRTIILVV